MKNKILFRLRITAKLLIKIGEKSNSQYSKGQTNHVLFLCWPASFSGNKWNQNKKYVRKLLNILINRLNCLVKTLDLRLSQLDFRPKFEM